jgi:hypothetical protein
MNEQGRKGVEPVIILTSRLPKRGFQIFCNTAPILMCSDELCNPTGSEPRLGGVKVDLSLKWIFSPFRGGSYSHLKISSICIAMYFCVEFKTQTVEMCAGVRQAPSER